MNRPNRGRSLSLTVLAGCLSVAFSSHSILAASAAELPGDPAVALQFAVEQSMLGLTNADRAANGLEPLDFDPDTLAIARQRAASQLGTPALSHYDAEGNLVFVALLTGAQIEYQLAGENLARVSASDATVSSRLEDALMKSPTHRKNILERTFTRLAVGSASNAEGQLTIAEVYRN